MSLPLKTLSHDAIPRALEKADRYRLLNEPLHAQSICQDILHIDPENQQALIILLLAITDQFGHGYKMGGDEPQNIIARFKGAYEQAYYSGIVAERRATAILEENAAKSGFLAHDLLTAAMEHYEEALAVRPAGNDDALLRWNTCARLMDSHGVYPRAEDAGELFLE